MYRATSWQTLRSVIRCIRTVSQADILADVCRAPQVQSNAQALIQVIGDVFQQRASLPTSLDRTPAHRGRCTVNLAPDIVSVCQLIIQTQERVLKNLV